MNPWCFPVSLSPALRLEVFATMLRYFDMVSEDLSSGLCTHKANILPTDTVWSSTVESEAYQCLKFKGRAPHSIREKNISRNIKGKNECKT